jgi:hypothetical protein
VNVRRPLAAFRSTTGTRRLPLRGADLVLLAMHSRPTNGPSSNNALLLVECDARISPARVRRALERFVAFCPWPASRLQRPFPWGTLRWIAGSAVACPPVARRSVGSRAALVRALETELDTAIDPRREPPLRLTIIDLERDHERPWSDRRAVRSVLVLTWFHPLMDPRGGQNLLGHLAELDRHGGEGWRDTPPSFEAPPDTRSLRERGRIARRSVEYMRSLALPRIVSPGTRVATHGGVRIRHEIFAHSGRHDDRALREIPWRLALVGKAMAELWEQRGLPDIPFVVPVAVDLRPKGEPGATFGNCLAFHFTRFRPSETRDLPTLAATLRRQMIEALRDGQIEANAVAMEFLRYRPLSRMLSKLPWTSAGESFSFNCADIGEFLPALESMFGARVLNAFHAPAVLPRPGIGIFFNRCGNTDNILVSWIEGVVHEDEVTRVIEIVRDGMGWRTGHRRQSAVADS